jgi:hypothetical protein
VANYNEHLRYVAAEIQSALDKLEAAKQSGPNGGVTLSNSEGTIIYRLLTEQLGLIHRGGAAQIPGG